MLSAFPHRRGAPALGSFLWPPLDPLQQVHVFPVLRAPQLGAGLQAGSHQSGVEGQNPLPRPAGHAAFDAARDTVGLLCCEHILPGHVQLFIPQHPQAHLSRAALNPFIPQPVLRFIWAQFSSLSRSLWMPSHPSGVLTAPLSLVSSADLLRVHSIPLCH